MWRTETLEVTLGSPWLSQEMQTISLSLRPSLLFCLFHEELWCVACTIQTAQTAEKIPILPS